MEFHFFSSFHRSRNHLLGIQLDFVERILDKFYSKSDLNHSVCSVIRAKDLNL